MKFVINEVLYDTSKMKCLGKVFKWYGFPPMFDALSKLLGEKAGKTYSCKLYKSKNGRYLLVRKICRGKYAAEAIEEDEAKELLVRDNIKAYIKHFGALEEA